MKCTKDAVPPGGYHMHFQGQRKQQPGALARQKKLKFGLTSKHDDRVKIYVSESHTGCLSEDSYVLGTVDHLFHNFTKTASERDWAVARG